MCKQNLNFLVPTVCLDAVQHSLAPILLIATHFHRNSQYSIHRQTSRRGYLTKQEEIDDCEEALKQHFLKRFDVKKEKCRARGSTGATYIKTGREVLRIADIYTVTTDKRLPSTVYTWCVYDGLQVSKTCYLKTSYCEGSNIRTRTQFLWWSEIEERN